jgi:hypothetical protein
MRVQGADHRFGRRRTDVPGVRQGGEAEVQRARGAVRGL